MQKGDNFAPPMDDEDAPMAPLRHTRNNTNQVMPTMLGSQIVNAQPDGESVGYESSEPASVNS